MDTFFVSRRTDFPSRRYLIEIFPVYITGWVDRNPTGLQILEPNLPINSGYPNTKLWRKIVSISTIPEGY